MSIKLTIDGATFEVETAAEAMELFRLAKPTYQAPIAKETTLGMGTPIAATYNQLRAVLDAECQKILDILAAHPNGIATAELIAAMGIDPYRLPHVIRRIAKPARQLGLDITEVYTSRGTSKGGKPHTIYTIDADLLATKGK